MPSAAGGVIPHSANYPPFHSLLPQISFRKLLSAFRISANYQHPRLWCADIDSRLKNINLSPGEIDYLILFEFCGMRNAEKTKVNLRNVPQVKFPKIYLFKFPHSAIRIPQSTPSQQDILSQWTTKSVQLRYLHVFSCPAGTPVYSVIQVSTASHASRLLKT